jgi:TRAP-type C4-dicarboxylate transport system permease small subunit
MAKVSDTADPGSPADPRGWRPWTFSGLIEGLNAVGTLCIFAVMILINFDIFGRFAFSSPVPGVKEIVELSIVGIVFLQLPHTLRVGRITRSDAAFNKLLSRFPNVAHVVSALYNLTGVLLSALIVYGSVPRFTSAWSDNHYIGNQGIFVAPVWPVRLIVVIGCACLAIQFALFVWRDLRRLRGGDHKVA